ncbi:hypothetical protein TNCV_3236401 [Trichonephila clavipes]|nr:hypothetical protein TNCV_3236401 [Trichonephila clavipes]
MFEDLIPKSGISQSFNSNDVKIGVPINGDASKDIHSPIANSETCKHDHMIIRCDALSPDGYKPIKMIRKLGYS